MLGAGLLASWGGALGVRARRQFPRAVYAARQRSCRRVRRAREHATRLSLRATLLLSNTVYNHLRGHPAATPGRASTVS